jgi:hypothetical protein
MGAADAGVQDSGLQDAGAQDAALPADAAEPTRPSTGTDRNGACSVARVQAGTDSLALVSWIAASALLAVRSRQRRRARTAAQCGLALAVVLAAVGCGGADVEDEGAGADAGMFVACSTELPAFASGLSAVGKHGRITATLLEASRYPPRKYENEWLLTLSDIDGAALLDAHVSRVETFMPVHGHYGRPPADFETLPDSGRMRAQIHFTMRGPWQVQLDVSSAKAGADELVFEVCVEE